MALRHSDAAVLISLPFTLTDLTFECTFPVIVLSKKSVNIIIFMGCNGILCIFRAIGIDEG